MANLDKMVDDLSKLTVMEAAELSKLLEDKWGVSAAAPVAVAAAGAVEAAEEQTEFDVVLTSDGGNKMATIKAIREIDQSLGLVEAKTLVESAPKTVKEAVSKEEANKVKETLEKAGAKVEIK